MHELPMLSYPFTALEPHIDALTMEIHHDRHHATYVANLNKALEGSPEFAGKSLEDLLRGWDRLPQTLRAAVRNHGGGHANHSLFWEVMGPGGGGAPAGDLATSLDKAFGSFTAFQEKLTAAAVGQFGSGWGWLVVNGGALEVVARPNQDSPLMEGSVPILGVDVWEHAYYLKYQNKRADYLKSWWNVVRWDKVSERFRKAMG